MKMKILPALFFAFIIALASCSGDSSVSETKAIDSSKMRLPAELEKLNSQIIGDPSNASYYHKRAQYFLNAKSFDAGFEDMRKVMMIDSTKAEYFITLSDLYFLTNQTGSSKASLEKCIQLDDKNVTAMLKLAELYFYVKKADKCFEYLNMALKIDKYNPKAYFMKGMNYKELKDTAKAISSMQTAVEQDQTFYNAYMQLGLLTAGQKNQLAVEYYKNALRIQPNSSEVWYGIGKFYQDVENWEKAIEAYNVLLQIDPQNKNVQYNLAVINMAGLKKYKIALEYFTAAIKIDAAYVDAYFGRGVCYQEMGDKKNAKADFQACLSINAQYEPALKALGEK
jgi:tetratricopeptide (TPR) repeat protein